MPDALTVQDWYKDAKDNSAEWRTEAKELYDLVAGRQWTEHEESLVKEKRRTPIVMNRIAPFVDSIIGQQINNRKELRFLPREISDTSMSDIYTEANRWADDLCEGEDEVSDAFFDMVVCGMGWTETRMDYSDDPDGRLITAERIDPFEMYWPMADNSRNLSKAKWLIRARKYDREDAESRWPEIKNVAAEWTMDDDQMRQPHDATNAWKYEQDQSAYFPSENMYLVLQCQYWKEEDIYRLADPTSGQLVTIPKKRFDALKPYIEQYGIKYVKQRQKKYYVCYVCGSELLEKKELSTQRGFIIKCMTAKRDRNRKQWYGAVRALKDPQKFSNKFFSDMMFILATNRKGGAFVEEDALVDPRKAEEDWAAPDALIKLNSGGLQKVRERDAGVFPAGLDRLMQYAIDAVPQTSGINPELVGMADRNQPGILEGMRKQAGLTILAPLFDALKRHQRSRGEVVLDYLHRFVADGRAIRIMTPEGERESVQFLPAPDAATYDIIVDEMPTTPNSKAETFQVLAQLVPFMAKMGVMPPPEVLDYLPLPATLVEKWRGNLQQGQDQPDPEQMVKQMEAQAKQQELQAKQQMEMMKIEHEREKMALEQQETAGETQLKQMQMNHDMAVARQEAEIRAAELEVERAKLTVEANQVFDQMALVQNSDKMVGDMQSMVEKLVSATQELQTAQKENDERIRELASTAGADRVIVRDDRGRAIGVSINGETVIEVVRDESGRATGTRKKAKAE